MSGNTDRVDDGSRLDGSGLDGSGLDGSGLDGPRRDGTQGVGPPLDRAKLAAARLWATSHHPYLASAVFATPTLPAPDVGRLVIDRWWRIHADPEVVNAATVEQLGGELLHLTSHVLRDHASRADELHFTEADELHHWVDAADAEIGDDFSTDLPRVSEPVRADDLDCVDGRLAEEYYRTGSVRADRVNDCGSGAHGEPPPWEPPPPRSRSDEDSSDTGPGVDRDRQELIRRAVAAEIARADAETVSDGLRRWAEERLRPTVDWRAELAASLRRAVSVVSGAVDYSYRRPSRRSAAVAGVVLPALRRPTVEVAVVVDTSASVSEDLLGSAVAEVDGLLRSVGTRSVRLLACDDAVRTVDRVTNSHSITLPGGGGTDMAVGIDAAMERRPAADLIVVLTDGHTPWPKAAPAAPVVVGLLEDPDPAAVGVAGPVPPPEWARTIRITDR